MSNEVITLNVEGMACQHCVISIEKAVSALPGVSRARVNLRGKQVTVDYDSGLIDPETIKNTIEDQGYEVK
ncbi:MAG TPA: copper chaperone CopZ [Firmicutes bacterium]|jgi:copper chaperone|nr:copper chaperone CopZ [Bacillota bacterium]